MAKQRPKASDTKKKSVASKDKPKLKKSDVKSVDNKKKKEPAKRLAVKDIELAKKQALSKASKKYCTTAVVNMWLTGTGNVKKLCFLQTRIADIIASLSGFSFITPHYGYYLIICRKDVWEHVNRMMHDMLRTTTPLFDKLCKAACDEILNEGKYDEIEDEEVRDTFAVNFLVGYTDYLTTTLPKTKKPDGLSVFEDMVKENIRQRIPEEGLSYTEEVMEDAKLLGKYSATLFVEENKEIFSFINEVCS